MYLYSQHACGPIKGMQIPIFVCIRTYAAVPVAFIDSSQSSLPLTMLSCAEVVLMVDLNGTT